MHTFLFGGKLIPRYLYMRQLLAKMALVSFALLASACSNNAPSSKVSLSSEESSAAPSSISSVATTTSKDTSIVDNQLSTADGLVVTFKAQGARIDKIKYGNKQIAKDGFTVGRVANRIAGGTFTLNGTQYNVKKNDGNNSLHGGGNSWQGPFATANWTKVEQTASSIKYSIHSNDKDNGYPGNMDMTVTYTLSQAGELSIEYSATTDADTLCNPTNHLFMDLNGNSDRNYANVKLWINADNYTPLQDKIPTGAISPVEGTQYDYRTEKAVASKEYDDNYVLNGEKDAYRKVATMTGTSAKIKVDVYTDRPGLQFYKDGNGSICLETQMLPDAINHASTVDAYGTTILRAGETFIISNRFNRL